MKTLMTFLVMLFAASAMAARLPVEDLTFDWQGRHFRCTVSIEEVMASPSWIVSQPAPPLATRKASQLAESYATNLVTHAAFILKKISLVHVTEDKWIYEVVFLPGLPDTYSGPFGSVTFVVFMDGLDYTTIIEPAEPLAGRRGSALER